MTHSTTGGSSAFSDQWRMIEFVYVCILIYGYLWHFFDSFPRFLIANHRLCQRLKLPWWGRFFEHCQWKPVLCCLICLGWNLHCTSSIIIVHDLLSFMESTLYMIQSWFYHDSIMILYDAQNSEWSEWVMCRGSSGSAHILKAKLESVASGL